MGLVDVYMPTKNCRMRIHDAPKNFSLSHTPPIDPFSATLLFHHHFIMSLHSTAAVSSFIFSFGHPSSPLPQTSPQPLYSSCLFTLHQRFLLSFFLSNTHHLHYPQPLFSPLLGLITRPSCLPFTSAFLLLLDKAFNMKKKNQDEFPLLPAPPAPFFVRIRLTSVPGLSAHLVLIREHT